MSRTIYYIKGIAMDTGVDWYLSTDDKAALESVINKKRDGDTLEYHGTVGMFTSFDIMENIPEDEDANE